MDNNNTGCHHTPLVETVQNGNSPNSKPHYCIGEENHFTNPSSQQRKISQQTISNEVVETTDYEINNLMTETETESKLSSLPNCRKNPKDVIIDPGDEPQSHQKPSPLIYKLTDTPPIYSLPFFVLQQGILAISTPLLTTFLVSKVICAGEDDEIKAKILSATFFMMGLSTFTMVTFGVRLPIFQGPNFTYVLPILSLVNLKEFQCPAMFDYTDPVTNSTSRMARIISNSDSNSNDTFVSSHDFITGRINEFAGSLIVVGAAHFLIGVTGFVGFIQRFVGPITIVPIILLFGIQIYTVVLEFTQTHWGTSMLTVVMAIVLGIYLEKYNTPIPCWTPSRGFFITWIPIHNVLAIFISIAIGWIICFILTYFNALSDDPESREYMARTDARFQVVYDMDWFLFPYPGQFGIPGFNLTAAISFFVATILSVLDSIIDYSASANISCAPQPPRFALNRGIAVEGLMILLGGAFGCGHGTVSFGENIGAIRISRVASIRVFQGCGIMYLIFAFIGKFGAFFITIPHSVMGGSQIITFGLLIGVVISNLQYIDLNSTRNISILGITLLLGMMMPKWVSENEASIDTGNYRLDNVLKIFLSNPSFVGGITACFMDNTIPGTKEERGIAFQIQHLPNSDVDTDDKVDSDFGDVSELSRTEKEGKKPSLLLHGREVYRLPWIPDSFRRSTFARFVPIFDNEVPKRRSKS